MSLEKTREILRLAELGCSQSEISQSCNVARSTVQDYLGRTVAAKLSYAEAARMSYAELAIRMGKGKKPAEQSPLPIDFSRLLVELGRQGVTLMLLWQGQAVGICGYSTFCRHFRQWLRQHKCTMRQSYKAGERMLVDYAGLTMPIVDEETRETSFAEIFVACLGFSSYTFTEATESQALCHWIGSHQRALQFYSGLPEIVVPDNLKSGVKSACWYEPELNRSYQDFAEYYGIAVLPARVRKPRNKAKVEKAVQEVERWVLAPLRDQTFHSIAELNAALRPLLEKLNNRRMRDYNASHRELFERVEKSALKALPTQPFTFSNWKKAKLNIDHHIEIERHYYSAPYQLVHREL